MASAGGLARGGLAEERKAWCKNHPFGFAAHPETLIDGSVNLMLWKCVIAGKEGAWKPSITVRQILLSVQDLFDNPNATSPAQLFICRLFTKNVSEYKKRVRQQPRMYPLPA